MHTVIEEARVQERPLVFAVFLFLERVSTVFETHVFVCYVLYRCSNLAPLRITTHAESRPHSFNPNIESTCGCAVICACASCQYDDCAMQRPDKCSRVLTYWWSHIRVICGRTIMLQQYYVVSKMHITQSARLGQIWSSHVAHPTRQQFTHRTQLHNVCVC